MAWRGGAFCCPHNYIITEFTPHCTTQAYFGEQFDEDAIRNHFTLVYELMDETMDFGYPQNCAIEVLRQYINLGTVQQVRWGGCV